jgi:hypothetical protein
VDSLRSPPVTVKPAQPTDGPTPAALLPPLYLACSGDELWETGRELGALVAELSARWEQIRQDVAVWVREPDAGGLRWRLAALLRDTAQGTPSAIYP